MLLWTNEEKDENETLKSLVVNYKASKLIWCDTLLLSSSSSLYNESHELNKRLGGLRNKKTNLLI